MGLSRVAIIVAPTQVVNSSSSVIAMLAFTLIVIFRCLRVLHAVSLSLHNRTSWFAWQLSCVCRILGGQAYPALKLLQHHAAILVTALWKAKSVRHLRKKVVFEFFTLMLGSCGNSLCLLLFWPGWWFLALILALIWVAIRWSTG
ncbi:uncharacterized protein F4812DRAFT_288690 [Daldinia caldariorum]|uniref:uncharacterized protein n=1 Tax=Daldinia caldariorum TaxID=326644 RepID=UPI002007BCF0|nr:uncharacterized protein F4812DRAFT_288690 [Daldinia caldariorum]KAI1462998.1 hypothetical protein F4812DRAFT_288690 [Daldinia caldariorum]